MDNYEIHRVQSKSGKRALFFPTVNGKRINRTNFARKYDAKGLLRAFINNNKATS